MSGSLISTRSGPAVARQAALVEELLSNSHIAVGRAKHVMDASARPALSQTLEMEITVQEYLVAAAREQAAREQAAGDDAAAEVALSPS